MRYKHIGLNRNPVRLPCISLVLTRGSARLLIRYLVSCITSHIDVYIYIYIYIYFGGRNLLGLSTPLGPEGSRAFPGHSGRGRRQGNGGDAEQRHRTLDRPRHKDYLALTKWDVGDILECQVYHDDFEYAGSVIMIVLDQPVKEQKVYECSCAPCEDRYYKYYVEIQTGANPGLYFPAVTEDEEAPKVGSRTVTPIYQWRLLNANGLEADLTKVRWLKGPGVATVLESLPDKRKLLKQPPPVSEPSGGLAPTGSQKAGRGLLSFVEPSSSGSTPGVGSELRALAAELSGRTPEENLDKTKKRKAEEPKPAAGNRGELPEASLGNGGKLPEATNSNSAKKAKPLEAETPKGAPEPKPTLSDTEDAAESDHKKKKEKKGRKRPKKNSKKKKKKKKKKNKKKKSKKHKKKKKKKKKNNRADTSPSGSEPRDSSGSSDEEDSSDSSESLFRLASRSTGKVSQARLVAWSKDRPGRLASQCMQKMQDRTGREGEQVKWPKGVMHPAATAYYLRVLSLGTAQRSLRTLREMKTLCAPGSDRPREGARGSGRASPEAESPGARSRGGELGLSPVLRAHPAGQGHAGLGRRETHAQVGAGVCSALQQHPPADPMRRRGYVQGRLARARRQLAGQGVVEPLEPDHVPAH